MISRVHLKASLVRAVARAVADMGGDMRDVEDMLDVWARYARFATPRADAIRGIEARRRPLIVGEAGS